MTKLKAKQRRSTLKMKKNIVTIGGGGGQFILLQALMILRIVYKIKISISAIVSMADNGGSTGLIRKLKNTYPAGDLTKCLCALMPNSEENKVIINFLNRRVNGSAPDHGDHSVKNLLFTGLNVCLSPRCGTEEQDLEKTIDGLCHLLEIKDHVVPVTLQKVHLGVLLEDGEIITGETAIDLRANNGQHSLSPIEKSFLLPEKPNINSRAREAIKNADYIILSQGDFYTSLTPNFLVAGMIEAVKSSSAKIIYVTNIMTKAGETDNWKLQDFIKKTEELIQRPLDVIICNNNSNIDITTLSRYAAKNCYPVIYGALNDSIDRQIIAKDLVSIDSNSFIRHCPEKLSSAIHQILSQ